VNKKDCISETAALRRLPDAFRGGFNLNPQIAVRTDVKICPHVETPYEDRPVVPVAQKRQRCSTKQTSAPEVIIPRMETNVNPPSFLGK
jgi:hypothetical protein